MRELVDRRWSEYGLEAGLPGTAGFPGSRGRRYVVDRIERSGEEFATRYTRIRRRKLRGGRETGRRRPPSARARGARATSRADDLADRLCRRHRPGPRRGRDQLGVRDRHRRRGDLRVLWIRDGPRRARRAGAGAVVAPSPLPSRRARRRARALPAHVFLERTTLGLGAVIGAVVTVPVVGFAVAPTFIGQGRGHRPRPDVELPGGRVARNALHLGPGEGSGLQAHRVRPQQRPHGRGAELHDRLQPLRPPRLPDAARRADRRRRRRSSSKAPGHADPDGAVELLLPLPRRLLRYRGQSGSRPARARSRPLQVLHRRRHIVLGERDTVGKVEARSGRGAVERTRASIRASTSTGPRLYPLPDHPAMASTDPKSARAQLEAVWRRSTGSRSAPASSAGSGTSSSATSRRTSAGCRRSARRR